MTNQEVANDNERDLTVQAESFESMPSGHSRGGKPLNDDPDRETIEPDLLPLLRSKQFDREPYIQFVVQWCRVKVQTNMPHTDQVSINDRDRWLIGRSRRCAVVLPDPTISRYHAVIGYDVLKGFYVKDMESHNGTFLNQRLLVPLQCYALRDGDIVALNRQIIQVNIHYSDWDLMHDLAEKYH